MNFDNEFKKEIEAKAPLKKVELNKIDNNIITKSVEDVHKKEGKELPKISPDMLPTQISKWVSDICERIESPFEVGVVNALTLIGNLIGNRVAIKPKQNDYNYLIYPNLWGVVVGSPSMKKTPVFNEISKSIARIQIETNKQYKKDIENYIEDMNLYTTRKKEFDKQSKTDDGKTNSFDMEKPKKPNRILHFTQDATIEAIAQIIDENPKGLLILRDELSGFLKNLDATGKEEYRSFYLEGWSSGQKSIERKGSPSLYIPKLTLGVLGNIQPSMIKNYIYEAVKGHKADGLIQRFQLLVFAEPIEVKGTDRKPNTVARDNFDNVIEYIINRDEFEGIEQNSYDSQPYYSYSNDAQIEFTKWLINNDKEAKQSINEALESHLAKYDKLINSLALIFHICELSNGYSRNNYDISLENFQRALKLTNVLKEHAKRLYSTFEIEEQKKDEMYQKIENKLFELKANNLLPMSFGKISQMITKANAEDVKKVAKDIAYIKGRQVTNIK